MNSLTNTALDGEIGKSFEIFQSYCYFVKSVRFLLNIHQSLLQTVIFELPI
jgi:hypothetical protein